MATWRELITQEMIARGETWDDVEASVAGPSHWDARRREGPTCNLEGWLDREFHDGCGSPEGHDFTLWTKNRVYFSVVYDGSEWAGSVPRNPCAEATDPKGGW